MCHDHRRREDPFADASPGEIRAALIPEDHPEFDTCAGATFTLGTATLFGFPEQIPTSGVPVPTAAVPGGPTR